MPPLPWEVEHIWGWFSDLDCQRSAGFSVNALAWADIWAYFRLRHIDPHDWEVRAIQALDGAFIESRTKNVAVDAADAKGLKDRMTGAAGRERDTDGRRNRRGSN